MPMSLYLRDVLLGQERTTHEHCTNNPVGMASALIALDSALLPAMTLAPPLVCRSAFGSRAYA